MFSNPLMTVCKSKDTSGLILKNPWLETKLPILMHQHEGELVQVSLLLSSLNLFPIQTYMAKLL